MNITEAGKQTSLTPNTLRYYERIGLCLLYTSHWHGAAPDSWFAHLAVEVPAEGASNELSLIHIYSRGFFIKNTEFLLYDNIEYC